MKLPAILSALSLTFGCHTAPEPPAPPIAEAAPMPANLEQLVSIYQRQAGVTLTYDEHTAAVLSAIAVTSIGATGDVLLIGPAAGDGAVFEVIPLHYADAAALAGNLRGLVDSAGAGASDPGVRIGWDERSNSLIVRAAPEHQARLEELIELLDVERPAGD